MPNVKDVPVLPGRLPLLGHGPLLWRRPLDLLCGLRNAGPVVRVDLGVWPVYFVTDPNLIHELMVANGPIVEKGRLFQRAKAFVGVGLTTSDGELHRRQRRLIQPAFHHARMPGYAEIMDRSVRRMLASWRDGETVRIDRAMYELTATTVTTAMFSVDVGARAVAEILLLLPAVANGLFTRTLLPASLSRLPLPANRRFDGAVARLRAVVDELVADAHRGPADRTDLLSMLVAARDADTGRPMSQEQLRDEAITIMMSGTETTAITLAWAFHELAHAPAVLERMRAELDAIRGTDGGPIEYAQLADLTYTDQVLREVMRLHAIPLVMRRATAVVRLGDTDFPAGTELSYSPYALHRDPRFFPEPTRFDPDRWADSERTHGGRASVPFGMGKRKCIGDTFAWAELMTALAAIVTDWDLRPASVRVPRELISASIPRPDTLPMVVTTRR